MLQLSSPITSVRLANLFSMRTNRNQLSKNRFQSASSCGLQRFFPFFFHLIPVEVRFFPQQFPAGVQQLITGIGRPSSAGKCGGYRSALPLPFHATFLQLLPQGFAQSLFTRSFVFFVLGYFPLHLYNSDTPQK